MPEVEDDEFAEMRRSRRSNVSKKRQQNVLEELKQARATGKAYRKRVDDLVEDLYMEVDEAEYEAKKREHRSFVENDGSHYYDEEDDSEDEFEEEERSKKSKKSKKEKPKAGTIKHHFQVVTNKQKAQDEHSLRVDDDDILKECLADIIGTGVAAPSDSFDPFISELPTSSNSFAVQNVNISSPKVLNRFRVPSPTTVGLDEDVSAPVIAAATPSPEENVLPRPSLPIPSPPLRPLSPSPPASPPQQRKRKDADVHSPEGSDSRRAKVARVESPDVLKFFFIDAYEDAFRNPGKVYLFGRAKEEPSGTFSSCCLALKDISRKLFFIKREKILSSGIPATVEDLENEVRTVFKTKFGIRNIKCKPELITKKFICADESVPKECQTMEVCVNWNTERIPSDLSGDCFSHVMNTTATALERLMVECEIYGPCWLSVRNAVLAESPVSYCPLEYNVGMSEMKSISMALNCADPLPPISIISVNVLTALNPDTKESQVVMVSLIEHNCNLEKSTNFDAKMMLNKRFCVVAKLKKGLTLPFDLDSQLKANGIDKLVRKVGNEISLLNIFLMKMEEINPDLILGHDLNAQLVLIQGAIERHKLQRWDRLGRLKRRNHIQRVGHSKSASWDLTTGRLCLDSKTAAMELVRARSYGMEELVARLLKVGNRGNLSIEQISEPFLETNPKVKLIELIKWNWNENFFAMKIVEHLNAIPLFVQITQIVGGVMSRTLMGGRAERNEYLLLHACFKSNYVPPDKRSFNAAKAATKLQKQSKDSKNDTKEPIEIDEIIAEKGGEEEENGDNEMEVEEIEEQQPKTEEEKHKKGPKQSKKGPQYTGGLVLEPMKGLYETFVVLLDFNSLYPTIIQEFNICFTTVDSAFDDLLETELPTPPGSSRPDGLLKTEIRKLVNRRREVKEWMSRERVGTDKYKQYNIRQLGLKLTANSMYGCLGFQNSRFCAKTLAAMVTAKGRELLLHAKSIVENENFSVIYGDTDSIMVNTNSTDFEQAKQIAQKLKQAVNRNYSLLELDIDGIYKRLLLLKKKKYAALAVDLNDESVVTQELKGLDIVRRDWSQLAKEIGEDVVNLILSSVDRDTLIERIRATLAERRADIEAGRVALDKFEILKQLTRNPSEYKDTKAQPHALVAIRLNESKKFRLRQGDVVNYVICKDGTVNPATQRAYHPSEILADENLSVDIHYYLAHQIHPVVSRLCEPIEEIDACQIAEIIGLDPSVYRQRQAETHNKVDLAVIFAPFSST
ncbi:hypothetical protein niasHS_002181 [Heterodera schachtii]|uniref:DNA polymerase n=1 Tax=Heterodera schachtii TaxID=97005 RepID=A0ABD2KP19_HETSC